ncbi:E3 SUMO-protein ligase KIAA1586-like [Myzus persicae]|uniref:E3 SUMO-protein ligase KIAA1586-like n=1 Tax=Myzus persicae TaxID=13164 RepID=UPI000B93354E|nr:E3 SUMO-protein ligase KIAA1586-like [Myzus persicae]
MDRFVIRVPNSKDSQNTIDNFKQVSTENNVVTSKSDLQPPKKKKKMVIESQIKTKKNTSFDMEVPSSDFDNNPEVPQINITQMTNNDSEIVKILWPSDWSAEQWAEKKQKYTWLYCQNGLLGCTTCSEVSNFKTFKSQDFEISKEWSSCQINGGNSIKKETRLASLRNKIKRHTSSKAHKTAFHFIMQKEENVLSKQFEKSKIVTNIIETGAKLSVLIDESTTVSAVCGMVVFIKASISCDDPIFIFLDLVELVSQTAENIVNQLIECLKESGFNDHYLINNWISFVSDGASVLLGKKNGVAKRLQERYPLIFSLHCMNHRLELAVGDSVKDVNAVGRVLDVRWVASSLRAVKVVWKMFEALCNHFSSASSDINRDGKTRAKYSGLRKRLASPEFLLDLGLMCDCLNELSVLSNILQKRSVTLIQAQQHINRSVRVLVSFKELKGEYMTKATVAVNDMSFKNIKLEKNSKLVNINHNQFLTSLVDNLKSRLLDKEQDISVIQDMQIMDTTEWPDDYNIRYGEDKINRLCKRFQLNKNDAINAECERGFSLMNNICTKLRSRLTIQHMVSLMFININGPPLEQWEPETYVSSWLEFLNIPRPSV